MADIPADILIYAVVAGGLIFWLRNVLGTRHGDERERPNPFVTSSDPASDEDAKRIPLGPDNANAVEDAVENIYDPYSDDSLISNEAAANNLREFAKNDRSFDPVAFKRGAEDAFILIIEAFADGDRGLLKNLLAEDVYKTFEAEIIRREKAGEKVITEIQAIRDAKITDVHVKGKNAYISVEFRAEETCVIENHEGERIAGNPNRATEMVDIWTFGRNIKSKDPTWYLYETRDGEPEDHKTPIPEAGDA